MEIRNLDDGSTQQIPEPRYVRRDSVNGAPVPNVTGPDLSMNMIRPPRQFPPIMVPTYTVRQRPSVGSFVAAIGIIFGGLIAFLFLVAWIAGQL